MRIARVATYNVRHGLGMDDFIDLRRAAAVIRSLDVDIVGVQEVERGWARSEGEDQPSLLAEATGMEIDFFPVVSEGDTGYGIALLSKSAGSNRHVELPRVGDEEPRGAIVASWKGFTVVTTHLSRDAKARKLQTEYLALLIGGIDGPVVLVGDLNQPRRHLGPLRRAGLEWGPARLPTHPSTRPRHQIDYVLAGGGASVRQAWTTRTTASDHVPLAAAVEIPLP